MLKVLSAKVEGFVRQISTGSQKRYMIQFKDREPLEVHLEEPKIIRTLTSRRVYRFAPTPGMVVRVSKRYNQDSFDRGESFKGHVTVGKKELGSLLFEPV